MALAESEGAGVGWAGSDSAACWSTHGRAGVVLGGGGRASMSMAMARGGDGRGSGGRRPGGLGGLAGWRARAREACRG